ncbi:MAG: hypothetical protein QOJ51_1426 [Acidobacteriaceae bacterium]|jgi:hypothetical protein|nr:hypothetical protein [Acidobacteriaceae bacterium]
MQELVAGYFEEPAIEIDFAAVSRGFDPGGDCRVKDLGRISSRSSLL